MIGIDAPAIENALTRLAELRAALDVLRIDYEAKRAALIPVEVLEALAELDEEHRITAEAAAAGREAIEAEIKALVAQHGASVKAAGLQAVYSAGRVSWDTKALDGYAAAHPEIAPFRKVGEPSVSIRGAK